VVEEAFREHFGYEPFAFDAWRAWIHAAPGYDPGLSVLAWSGERLVGAAVNFGSDDGIGWIGDLGVLEAWRGRGIGAALLARSFEVLAEAGHREARLGVDTGNASGATRLYRSAGMSVRRRFDLYERELVGA
jgi:ribosomal protein S18 acetylase RimI-like enzyme